jgi:signal transduction histidine kinase
MTTEPAAGPTLRTMVRSSAFALAASYVALGVLALILFAAPLWYGWQVTINDGRAEIMHEDAQRLTSVFQRVGAPGLKAFIDARVGLQIADERMLLLTDPGFTPLAGNLSAWPTGLAARAGTYTLPIALDGRQTRAVVVIGNLPGGYHLLVGRDLARFAPLTTGFWYGLAAAVGILIMVGIAGGLMLRRALLSRIHTIGRSALAIIDGDLRRRLPTGTRGDELDALASTINRLLDQIEQLFDGIRNVSDSIAHDLRTPLAELRSRLEELSLTRPSGEETFAEIDAAVVDVDRVIRIFNALLRLAEIDAGLRRSGFVEFDAASVLEEAVEFYLPAAELRGVRLEFREVGPVPLLGDPLLLAQAVGNLIDNALKYARANGVVQVGIERRADGRTVLAVADDGPGIGDAEKPKAAERFYRGESSRGSPGVGLGLSLVQSVARLHGGRLELLDNHPGLRAQISLEPRQAPAAVKVAGPLAAPEVPPTGLPASGGTPAASPT